MKLTIAVNEYSKAGKTIEENNTPCTVLFARGNLHRKTSFSRFSILLSALTIHEEPVQLACAGDHVTLTLSGLDMVHVGYV